eukprot:403374207
MYNGSAPQQILSAQALTPQNYMGYDQTMASSCWNQQQALNRIQKIQNVKIILPTAQQTSQMTSQKQNNVQNNQFLHQSQVTPLNIFEGQNNQKYQYESGSQCLSDRGLPRSNKKQLKYNSERKGSDTIIQSTSQYYNYSDAQNLNLEGVNLDMKKSCNFLELPKTNNKQSNYSSGKLSQSYRKDSSEGYVSDCSTQADLTEHYDSAHVNSTLSLSQLSANKYNNFINTDYDQQQVQLSQLNHQSSSFMPTASFSSSNYHSSAIKGRNGKNYQHNYCSTQQHTQNRNAKLAPSNSDEYIQRQSDHASSKRSQDQDETTTTSSNGSVEDMATVKKPKKLFRNDLERDNFVRQYQMKKKTEMCRNWEISGKCKFMDSCSFAHGKHELVKKVHLPSNYKTKICTQFHTTAFCPYGNRCQFLHSQFDLLHQQFDPSVILNENARLSDERSNQLKEAEEQMPYVNVFQTKRLRIFEQITHTNTNQIQGQQNHHPSNSNNHNINNTHYQGSNYHLNNHSQSGYHSQNNYHINNSNTNNSYAHAQRRNQY